MNLRAKAAGALAVNMLFWLLMLLALAGVLALAGALFLVLVTIIGAAGAAAVTGVALLLVAGASVFCVHRAVRSTPAAASESSPGSKSLIDEASPVVGDRVADFTREHTGIAVGVALAAGVAFAVNPRLRRMLLRTALTRTLEPPLRREVTRIIGRYSDD